MKDHAASNGPERAEWAELWEASQRATHEAQDGSALGMQRAMDTFLRVRYGAPTPRPEWTRVMEAIVDPPAASTLVRRWRWMPAAAVAAVVAVATVTVLACVLRWLPLGGGEVNIQQARARDERKEDGREQHEVIKPHSEDEGGGERSEYETRKQSNQENEKEAEMKIESIVAAGMVMAMLTNVTAAEQATTVGAQGTVALKVAFSTLDGVVESRDHVVLNLVAKPVGSEGAAEKVTVLLKETTRIQSYGRGQEVANRLTMASLVKGVKVVVLVKELESGKKEAVNVVVKEQ